MHRTMNRSQVVASATQDAGVLGTRPWSDAAVCNAPAAQEPEAPALPATGGGRAAVRAGILALVAVAVTRLRTRRAVAGDPT